MSENLKTVAAVYEAFGRGDIEFILDKLAEDVAWEQWGNNVAQKTGVPWLQSRRGKEGVLEFFSVVGSFDYKEFSVLSLMEGKNQVAAEIVIEASVPATNGHFRDEEIHLWTFDDAGKITRMRHYTDTAKHIAAARLGASTAKES